MLEESMCSTALHATSGQVTKLAKRQYDPKLNYNPGWNNRKIARELKQLGKLFSIEEEILTVANLSEQDIADCNSTMLAENEQVEKPDINTSSEAAIAQVDENRSDNES